MQRASSYVLSRLAFKRSESSIRSRTRQGTAELFLESLEQRQLLSATTLVGDFNGDGAADQAVRLPFGSWFVSLNNGAGKLETSGIWTSWSPRVAWNDVMAADIDGDGRDDIVGRASTGAWWAALAGDGGFTNRPLGTWSTGVEWLDVMTGDFNGNGRQDLIGRSNRGAWWVGSTDASGSFSSRYVGSWSPAANWQNVFAGDFNGDGRDDIAGQANGVQWWVGSRLPNLLVNTRHGLQAPLATQDRTDGTFIESISYQGRITQAIDDTYVFRMDQSAVTGDAFDYQHNIPVLPRGWTARSLGYGFYNLRAPGTSLADVTAWANTAGVKYAEPSIVHEYAVTPNDTYFNTDPVGTAVPTNGLWGMRRVDMEAAWATARGASDNVVAVLDSGVDIGHPDLQANIWRNLGEIPGNGIDDDRNGYIDDVHGWNTALGNGDVDDTFGHGTHVAGTMAAVGNNRLGVTGVNWSASIMVINANEPVINAPVNTTEGILYVVDQARRGVPISVINMSLGSVIAQPSQGEAIALAGEAGITVVAAAGNSAEDNDATPHYPANYGLANIISVANSSEAADDALAVSSNYGAVSVDLAAPGQNILSTSPRSLTPSGYRVRSGTSMASPLVAGAVALLKSAQPQATISDVREALFSSVDRSAALNGLVATGGRMNVAAALRALAGGTDPTGTPGLSIISAGIMEGDYALTPLEFTITLSRPTTLGVEVRYQTVSGTATGNGVDFYNAFGTAYILPNETSTTIQVLIVGDRAVEGDETFSVVLTNPLRAEILTSTAIGTIYDDDA